MNVLQILPALEVGGVERGVIDLARAMKEHGDKTVVISSGGRLVTELEKMGVPHYTLPVHKKSLLSLRLIPKIAQIIQRERVDLVHARSRVPAWLAWFAARQTGTPFITTCHGYYSTHFLSRIMGWGKRVIAISRIIGRHMIDHFGVAPSRIRLIHRGIDLSQFRFHPDHYNSTPRTLRIINVARLSPIKGQVEFLRAVHQLRSRLQNIEVWIVGSEVKGKSKYTELLEETIQQLGLQSCVKMLGTRRDVAELTAQADVAVLSTLVPEAFGRTVVEAGAVGTAVVATRVGGVLDIIDDHQNGRLVPPGDIKAMAEAMFEILTDRETCRTYALNLRKKIENQFTLDMMVQRTMEVYREVKNEKKILAIKLGAAGDLILVIPSLRMIREKFPDASFSLLVDKRLAPLVARSPHLNEIIPVDRNKMGNFFYLLKLAKKLRKEGYDISVDFQNSKWTHLLAFLSGIHLRYGFVRGIYGFLLNRPDRGFSIEEAPVRHQFRIVSKLGVTQFDDRLELWPEETTERRVSGLIGTQSIRADGSRIVGLVIGSSPKWPSKRWPVEYFRQLTDRLTQEMDCHVVLIGSSLDLDGWKNVRVAQPDKVTNWIGQTTLEEMIALVKQLDVLVTGDTAPLHVASAVQTKIIALFGPTNPRRHMPPGSGSIVHTRHLACQPCYEGICSNDDELACLKRISVDEVFESVRRQLATDETPRYQDVKSDGKD